LLAEAGQAEAALQAYGRVVDLGSVADGQIGRAQALERLGRPDEAVAAYRAALGTASDDRLRTLAQARLQVLKPGAGPAPAVVAAAYLQLVQAADEPLVPSLGQALEKAGVAVPKQKGSYAWELVKQGPARGEVRYFFPEDRQVAERARTAVQQALAVQGIDRVLAVQAVDAKKLGLASAQRGRVEVWMPAIATLRGLRLGIFVCTAAGEPAAATAEKAEAVVSALGASTMLRPIDEAARVSQFGVAPLGHEIRYSETIVTERLVARLLSDTADFAGLAAWRSVATKTPTPGYMSLFVCPEAPKLRPQPPAPAAKRPQTVDNAPAERK
jgi:tetratricopeptide (TPR) repeat protein